MNQLANINHGSTAVATTGDNPYAAYGAAATQNRLVGDRLNFNKGDWVYGQDAKDMPLGTRFVANMDQLLVGWIMWEDKKPVEQIMGLVGEGYTPQRRHELGHSDKEEWPTDDDGKPQDPWQLTNYLVLRNDEGDLFTFTTSSVGGRGAIGELCKIYGKEMRQRPNEYPVIEIGTGKYKHSDARRGWIKFPTLAVVGWAPKSVFDGASAGTEEQAEEEPPLEADPPPKKAGKTAQTRF